MLLTSQSPFLVTKCVQNRSGHLELLCWIPRKVKQANHPKSHWVKCGFQLADSYCLDHHCHSVRTGRRGLWSLVSRLLHHTVIGDGLHLSHELHMCWLSNPGRPCLCIFPSSHISPPSNLPQHSSSAATASLLKHHQHYLQNPNLPTHQTFMQRQPGLGDVFANQLKLFLLLVCFVREGDKNKLNYFCYKEEDKSFILNLKPLCKTQNRYTWTSLDKLDPATHRVGWDAVCEENSINWREFLSCQDALNYLIIYLFTFNIDSKVFLSLTEENKQ